MTPLPGKQCGKHKGAPLANPKKIFEKIFAKFRKNFQKFDVRKNTPASKTSAWPFRSVTSPGREVECALCEHTIHPLTHSSSPPKSVPSNGRL